MHLQKLNGKQSTPHSIIFPLPLPPQPWTLKSFLCISCVGWGNTCNVSHTHLLYAYKLYPHLQTGNFLFRVICPPWHMVGSPQALQNAQFAETHPSDAMKNNQPWYIPNYRDLKSIWVRKPFFLWIIFNAFWGCWFFRQKAAVFSLY